MPSFLLLQNSNQNGHWGLIHLQNGLVKSQTQRETWGEVKYSHWVQFVALMAKTSHDCCCSDNGSITGALLKDMLKAIDQLNVFDHTITGLNPFLLLDGHGSQFELEFLSYIHYKDTK